MEPIGTYQSRRVFWFDYAQFNLNLLLEKDWLCLAISDVDPNQVKFERFVRHCIENGISEFKVQGKFSEKIHDFFDETITQMVVLENHQPVSTITTWHEFESLADTFWQCFFATCIPETADLDNLSIVCTDLSGANRSSELKHLIDRLSS